MRRTILIKGNFSPLTKKEKAEILKIMRHHKKARFMIQAKDARFNPILKKEFKNILEAGSYDQQFEIKENTAFSFDEFYKYTSLSKEFILNDATLVEELLKQMVSDRRYEHTISVANTAVSLAKKHGVSTRSAYLAGIFHDLLKNYDEEALDLYLKHHDPKRLKEPFPIKHAYACKYYLKEHLNYYDYDVLQAIYHHADGQGQSRLCKILYIADKREPLRQLDPTILNIAHYDLNKAFQLLKIDVENYLKERHHV